jgi:hypothetical protein
MVRDKILKAYQARSEDENKDLNKYQGGDEYQGQRNNRGEISRFIEQGFYSNS